MSGTKSEIKELIYLGPQGPKLTAVSCRDTSQKNVSWPKRATPEALTTAVFSLPRLSRRMVSR
jgi:hypothetical protein